MSGLAAQVSPALRAPLLQIRKAAGAGDPTDQVLQALKEAQPHASTTDDLLALEVEATRLLFRRVEWERVVLRVAADATPRLRLLRALSQGRLSRDEALAQELETLEPLGGAVGDVAKALRAYYLAQPRDAARAAALCEQALEQDDSLWVARHLRCFALTAAERGVVALGELRAMVAEYPDDAAAQHLKGVLQFKAGNLAGALEAYLQARRYGKVPGSDFDLAEVMVLGAAELPRAVALLDAWLQRFPSDSHALLLRGLAHLRGADPLRAKVDLEAAARGGPEPRRKLEEYIDRGWIGWEERRSARMLGLEGLFGDLGHPRGRRGR